MNNKKRLVLSSLASVAVLGAVATTAPTDVKADNTPAVENTQTQAQQTSQVRVKVVDQNSNPVPGVAVDFMVNGKAMTIKADANGNADVTALAGQNVRYRVATSPAGYRNDNINGGQLTTVAGANNGRLALVKEAQQVATSQVRVKVVDQDGKAVANTPVDFMIDGKAMTIKSDAQGNADVTALAGQKVRYRVATAPKGYRNDNVNGAELTTVAGANNATLKLVKESEYVATSQVRVKVVDQDGKAVANTPVDFMIDGKAMTIKSDAQGNADVTALAGQKVRYRVATAPKGYRNDNVNGAELTTVAGANNATLKLVKESEYVATSQVRVKVVDQDGKAVANVPVDFMIDGKAMTIKSDAQGNADVTALAGQKVRYRVATAPKGYRNDNVNGAELTTVAGANNATLKLVKESEYVATSQVRIKVVDQDGKAIANVPVDFMIDGKAMTIKSDAQGNADVTALAGQKVRYRVATAPKGYRNDNVNGAELTTVAGANNATLKLVKESEYVATSQVRIKVVDQDGKAIANVPVDFMIDGKAMTIKSDAQGNADVTALAGQKVRYRVATAPKGYRNENLNGGELTTVSGMNNGWLVLHKEVVKQDEQKETAGKQETGKQETGKQETSEQKAGEQNQKQTGVKNNSKSEIAKPVAKQEAKAKVDTQKTKAKAELPQTGDTQTNQSALGLALVAVASGLAATLGVGAKKRKKG